MFGYPAKRSRPLTGFISLLYHTPTYVGVTIYMFLITRPADGGATHSTIQFLRKKSNALLMQEI